MIITSILSTKTQGKGKFTSLNAGDIYVQTKLCTLQAMGSIARLKLQNDQLQSLIKAISNHEGTFITRMLHCEVVSIDTES